LTDKSEACSPPCPFMIAFFLGKHFLKEETHGEHTSSV
jgi:hypothetical protein